MLEPRKKVRESMSTVSKVNQLMNMTPFSVGSLGYVNSKGQATAAVNMCGLQELPYQSELPAGCQQPAWLQQVCSSAVQGYLAQDLCLDP